MKFSFYNGIKNMFYFSWKKIIQDIMFENKHQMIGFKLEPNQLLKGANQNHVGIFPNQP